MPMAKTPTSSLTASQLLANKIWYRTKARILWLFYLAFYPATPSDPPATRSSPVTTLPQELVEMILSHFIYDTRTLLACSMTCYSWYIATVSHLHHTLTTGDFILARCRGRWWPEPLRRLDGLGLLPLVKRLRIRLDVDPQFTPEYLSGRALRYFSSLTNLQELGIDNLQVSSFIPRVQQCFGHLSQTLRFLALKKPRGSRRQVLYFIGLFPNLQDLKLDYRTLGDENKSSTGATLVPVSVPPLRGRLILVFFTEVTLVKDMVTFFGGLRFRHMELFGVNCTRLLLDECSETLETLRLYPNDPYVENRSFLRDSNLSRNKCLRTLETTAKSIDRAKDAPSGFLNTLLSSVTSPTTLDVVIIYRDCDFCDSTHCLVCEADPISSPHEPSARGTLDFNKQLKLFCELRDPRDFHLVLCVDSYDCTMEYCVQLLKYIVRGEDTRGGFDHLLYKPLIICERRIIRTRPGSLDEIAYASAL